MDSKRKRISDALKARLQDITPVNGYATDAGTRVRVGPGSVTPDDVLPRLALIFGVEPEVVVQVDKHRIRLPFVVSGLVAADASDPDDPTVAEPLLADVKRAMFRADSRTMGGLVINVHYTGESVTGREDGGTRVACSVGGAVEYAELYGDPELA
jgi:hypothetical protein